jgi:dTDP-4-dehydrorhamnose reductase
MNIGILGGFGFLGKNLAPILSQDHEIFLASRRSGIDAKNTQILIDWMTENKLDCVVNLAAN